MERGGAMPRHACGPLIFDLLAPNVMVAIFEGLGDKLAHVSDGMGAKDNVNVVEVGEKSLAITLSDAAANCDNAATARRLRQALTGGALSVQTCISRLANAARHKDNDIGIRGLADLQAPKGVEQAAHTLGIMKVHLATERTDEIGFT